MNALHYMRIIARALDYTKDPDPKHWKTINGSHVHLDKNGNYDGGAGSKFNGRHHYGPDWRQKSALMNRLAAALHGGVAKGQAQGQNVAPKATNGSGSGQGAANSSNLNTEDDYQQEIQRISVELNRNFLSLTSAELDEVKKRISRLQIEAASKGYAFTSGFVGKVDDKHIARIKEGLKGSPTDIRALWNLYEGEIRQCAHYTGSEGAHCFRNNVYYDINDVSKKTATDYPYETLFHENGHGIDEALGAGHLTYSATYNNGEFIQAIHTDVDKLVNEAASEIKEKVKQGDLKWLQDNGVIGKQYDLDIGDWVYATKFPPGFKYSKALAYKFIEKKIWALPAISRGCLSDIVEGATKGRASDGSGHGGAYYWKQRTYDGIENGLATEAFAEFTESHVVNKESLAVLNKFLPTASAVYLKMIKDAVSKEG